MNMDIVEGTWKEIRGKVLQRWTALTDDELEHMEGHRLELEGLLQKRYGYTRERAKQEVDSFLESL